MLANHFKFTNKIKVFIIFKGNLFKYGMYEYENLILI